MNVKNFNPFERHVEKIALAVAVAGAAYMIWMAYPPALKIDTPSGEVTADHVEEEVSRSVDQLEQARERTKSLKIPVEVVDEKKFKEYKPDPAHPKIVMLDSVATYKKINEDKPLGDQLVDGSGFPDFAPHQTSVDQTGPTHPDQTLPIATPVVPAPTDLGAVAGRVVVVMVPPVQPGAGGAPPTPTPVAGQMADKDLVIVKGVVDVGAFLKQMADPDLPAGQRLPASFQRGVIYQIEAEKRVRQSGTWGEWQAAKTNAVQPVELDWSKYEDLAPALNALDAQQKVITQPEYYPLPNGGSAVGLLLRGDSGVKTDTPGGGGGAAAAGAAGAAGGAAVARGVQPGVLDPGQPIPDTGMPGPPAGIPGGPMAGDAAAGGAPATGGLGQPNLVPFDVLDDQVQPGQEYQYRVRVVMYNPTYRWPHLLKDPSMKDKPTIASEWAMVPATVTVKANMYFFITGGLGGGAAAGNQRISARVFKWKSGQWYMAETNAAPGLPITATNMKVGLTKDDRQDVETGYTVVDVVPNSQGNDVAAVLLTPKGELITRDARLERSDPNLQDLIKQVQAARPPIVPTTRMAPPRGPTVAPIGPPPGIPGGPPRRSTGPFPVDPREPH